LTPQSPLFQLSYALKVKKEGIFFAIREKDSTFAPAYRLCGLQKDADGEA
jgi:hypothetical protein